MSAEKIDYNSPAVHSYLNILQGIINRMAGNSAQCKTWCTTLVSAILILSYNKDVVAMSDKILYMTFLPVIIFYFLDAYYLSMEREYVKKYNRFTKKLREGKNVNHMLYDASIEKGFLRRLCQTMEAFESPSTGLFYPLFGAILGLAMIFH